MIQSEIINDRIHIWSDLGLIIRQVETGALYEDVDGIYPHPWTYEETEEPIPDYPIEPQEALNILMGENDG
ncbi:MAG: hypothetical protein J5706_07135 [Elusimicrobiales bacterium]|nr:hypothetical protein [Elusimicrobiales bacterium]